MDFVDKQPIYTQIADYFCEKILTREWKENEKIPSVREIAVLMEVNPNTAIRAYNFLQEQNVIYNKRGIGYFVTEDGYAKVLEMKKNEFIHKNVPDLIKTMNLLNLQLDELIQLCKKYI